MMRETKNAKRENNLLRSTFYGVLDYLLAVAAGLFAVTLYLRTMAPGLLGGDSGEFQMAGWLGGFAHPTGYPLYLLLGYAWTHLLQLGDPAWRMNAFSALWAGVAIGLVYLLALRILQWTSQPLDRLGAGSAEWVPVAQRLLALFAALTFAVTPTFWSQAVIAEVYTLNAAFVAAILLGLVVWGAQPTGRHNYRPLYWTAAIYGLSLAHHRTILLLAPAIGVYLWLERRRSENWEIRFRGLVWALPLVLAPLLIYLYIPLRAPHVPYAEIPIGPDQTLHLYRPTVDWLMRHISGQIFSSAVRLPTGASDQLNSGVRLLVGQVSWAGLVLGLVGLVWLARRSRSLLALTGLSVAAVIAFNLVYGIGDIFVFYIPVYLIWALWMALGVAALGALFGNIARWRWPRARSVVWLLVSLCVIAFALPALLLLADYQQVDQSHNDQARVWWQAILAEPIPANAILISNDRDEVIPQWYLKYVEGIRTDVTGLFPLIQPTAEWADVGQVIATARRSERPVLLLKPMPGIEAKYRLEPAGSLTRVIGPAVEKPPEKPRAVNFGNAIRLSGYDLQPALVNGGDHLTVDLFWQPLHTLRENYTTFVHLVNADGRVVGQSDHQPGGIYYPTSLWRPGEMIKDTHTLTLVPDLGRPPYAIEVGLYSGIYDNASTGSGQALQHVGRPERIGLVGKARSPDTVPVMAHRLGFTFDEQVALKGYELATHNQEVLLRLFWQALRAPAADYTAFVHVLDNEGRIVAQRDQQPANGEMPTSTWPPGYALTDEMRIALPTDLPQQKYRLVAGLYDSTTQARLPAFDADGHGVGDSVPLGDLSWSSRQ